MSPQVSIFEGDVHLVRGEMSVIPRVGESIVLDCGDMLVVCNVNHQWDSDAVQLACARVDLANLQAAVKDRATLTVKATTAFKSFYKTEDYIGPLHVRNGVMIHCSKCHDLYILTHDIDGADWKCPNCQEVS